MIVNRRPRSSLVVASALLLVGLLVWSLRAGGPLGSASPARHTASAGGAGASAPSASASRATSASASTASACPERFGSYGRGNWPAACWRPYGNRSPFNIPIAANPRVASDSSAVVSNMVSHGWAFQNRHGAFTIFGGGSRPVYWARASDPVVSVSCRRPRACPGVTRLHVPQGASADRNSDGHLAVVDQSTRTEYDFWQASGPDHGVISASAASAIPLGPGLGTGLGGRAEAAYLGLMGGLLRGQELRAGVINHALVTTVECVESQDVWPAPSFGRGDMVCGGAPAPHLGSLLQLNMSAREIAASHAPVWQRAVMTAMARYGVYVVDTNGSDDPDMDLLAESDLSYTNFGAPGAMQSFVSAAGGSGGVTGVPLPLSRFRVLDPCVKRGGC